MEFYAATAPSILGRGDWIQTFTGRRFYPFAPAPEDVAIEDIAHSLSLLCRYTGHVQKFYSVAEHCLHVSREVPSHLALEGLLHDASEAYVNDLSRPVKRCPGMEAYREMEGRLHRAIAMRFGASGGDHQEIHEADTRMLYTERRDLLTPRSDWGKWHVEGAQSKFEREPYYHFNVREPLTSEEAEEQYLATFHSLMEEKNERTLS